MIAVANPTQGGGIDSDHHRDSLGYVSGDTTLVDLLQVDATHETTSYLEHLVSLPLRELVKQPASIHTEASTVESDLVNLCFREHPTFISVHKCSAAVNSAFDDFSGSLSRLISAIPSLEDECQSFASSTSSAQRVRAKAALVQEHQDKLLDLLELPQLMETCVRNGYYSEAMELLAHSKLLAATHPVALVYDVSKEVEAVLQLMLAQLLALLREPVKLPVLVKTVSFLRRLEAIGEQALGYVFLVSRLHNFRSSLAHIERDKVEPVRYVRKYIDLFREHVYDIIAQYTSIFDDAVLATSFAKQCILDLINLVSTYAPRISDPASMSSILVQLGYCAMSFARVGLDFSALVGPPFTSTVLSTFSHTLQSSANDLGNTLREAAKAMVPPSQILTVSGLQVLIDDITCFPPLATLANAHLDSFNALRLLAPLGIKTQIISLHASSLLTCSTAILQYLSQASATSDSDGPTHSRSHSRTHSRTPSSPRAHLLQRNSETQLSPEARAARRREIRQVCVACAEVWVRIVVPYLVEKLSAGVFGIAPTRHDQLERKLQELVVWIGENSDAKPQQESLTRVTEEPVFVPVPAKPPTTPDSTSPPKPNATLSLSIADDNAGFPVPSTETREVNPILNGVELEHQDEGLAKGNSDGSAPIKPLAAPSALIPEDIAVGPISGLPTSPIVDTLDSTPSAAGNRSPHLDLTDEVSTKPLDAEFGPGLEPSGGDVRLTENSAADLSEPLTPGESQPDSSVSRPVTPDQIEKVDAQGGEKKKKKKKKKAKS